MIHLRGDLYWIGGSTVYSSESVDPPENEKKHPFQCLASTLWVKVLKSWPSWRELILKSQPIHRQSWFKKLSLDVYKTHGAIIHYDSMMPWVLSHPSTAFCCVTIRWRELCWIFDDLKVVCAALHENFRCFIMNFLITRVMRATNSDQNMLLYTLINLPLLGTFALCQEILTAVCLCLSCFRLGHLSATNKSWFANRFQFEVKRKSMHTLFTKFTPREYSDVAFYTH